MTPELLPTPTCGFAWCTPMTAGARRRARRSSPAQGGDLDDYRMVRPDGRVVWVRDRAYAYRDDAGRVILEQGLLFDVTELKEAEARITHMAYHDALTGLPNRALFEESLLLAVERARRDRTVGRGALPGSRQLQAVNDSLGHHAGDLLLFELADGSGVHPGHRPGRPSGRRRVPDPARDLDLRCLADRASGSPAGSG